MKSYRYEVVWWGFRDDGTSDYSVISYDADGNPVDLDGNPIDDTCDHDVIARTNNKTKALQIVTEMYEAEQM